mgnify:CR=1 FL=1
MDDDVIQDMAEQDFDKVTEYFRIKKAQKTLRKDLKEKKIQHSNHQEIEELTKKLKALREEVKEDEQIKELKDKLDQLKERLDLMKEMIRIELIENAQEEVRKEDEDKKLKLVYVLKEMKKDDNKK